MVAAGAMGAYAADSVGDPNINDTMITIKGTPTGASGEHNFNAYRIGTYSNAVVTDDVLKSVDVTTNAKYTDVAKKALESIGVTAADPMAYVAEGLSDPQDNVKPWDANPQLRAFADALAQDIEASGDEPDSTFTYDGSNAYYEVDEGIWLLIDDQGIDGTATFGSLPILVSTDANNASFDPQNPLGVVNLKNQNVPTVTLTFAQQDSKGAFHTVDSPDFAIGADFYTQAVTALPYYTGYPVGNRTYALGIAFGEDGGEDGAGIGLADNDVEVTVVSVDGKTTQRLVKDKDYSIEAAGVSTIDFRNYVNGKGSVQPLEGGTLTVEAKTKLFDNAVVATPENLEGNPVTASLTYSSTPTDLSRNATACANAACAYATEDNYIYAYTYGYGVTKTDKSDESKLLGGAEFDVNGDGKTDYTTAADGQAKGTFQVNGVDSGTQTVTETKAPQGYLQNALPKFSFDIEPSFVNGATVQQKKLQQLQYSDVSGDELGLVSHTAGKARYLVANAKTVAQLPLTGGIGMGAVIVVALALASIGLSGILKSRVRSTHRDK